MTEVVALVFGLVAASLFPAKPLGVFTMRVTKAGAVAEMLAGMPR